MLSRGRHSPHGRAAAPTPPYTVPLFQGSHAARPPCNAASLLRGATAGTERARRHACKARRRKVARRACRCTPAPGQARGVGSLAPPGGTVACLREGTPPFEPGPAGARLQVLARLGQAERVESAVARQRAVQPVGPRGVGQPQRVACARAPVSATPPSTWWACSQA